MTHDEGGKEWNVSAQPKTWKRCVLRCSIWRSLSRCVVRRYVLSKATKLECGKALPAKLRSACIGMKSSRSTSKATILQVRHGKRSDGYTSTSRSPYLRGVAASAWVANGMHRMQTDRSDLEAQLAPDSHISHFESITEDATGPRKRWMVVYVE